MKDIEYFNPDKIIKAILVDKVESEWYKVKKEIKLFGITIRKCEIYDFLKNICDENEVYKKHILIDGIIYEKPKVIIYFDSNISKTFYLNDYQEGRFFINKFCVKYNLEKITKQMFY